jgi:hypothetical protein
MLAMIDGVTAAPDIVRRIACDAVTRDDAPVLLMDGGYFDAIEDEDHEIEQDDAFMALLREVWWRATDEEITLGFHLAVWAAQSVNSDKKQVVGPGSSRACLPASQNGTEEPLEKD